MLYFIYKPAQTEYGLRLPTPNLVPRSVRLGLAEQDGMYLGSCEKPEDLVMIQEYVVSFINEDAANAMFVTIDKDNTFILKKHRRSIKITEEEAKKYFAEYYKLKLKLGVRNNIASQIGDLYDLFADQAKRIDLLERLLLRLSYYLLRGEEIPEELKSAYLPLVESYIQGVDSGEIRTRIDIEDVNEIFEKLKQKSNKITEIVEKDYLAKRDQVPEIPKPKPVFVTEFSRRAERMKERRNRRKPENDQR